MKTFILLVFGLALTETIAWTGQQCSVPVVKQVTTSQCVYKNINCDPRHQDLTCCLNKTVTKEKCDLKPQCCPGPDDNMCNITSCLSCNDTQICDYNEDTCYDVPANNVLIILTLSEINRGSNTTESELIVYNWWTNTKGFNRYQLDLNIIQQPSPARPLTQCKTNVAFIKALKGSDNYNRSFVSSIDISEHRLTIEENNFDQHFDHGDILKTTVELYDSQGIRSVQKSMSLQFDYEPPTHCSETGTCQPKSTEPLSLNNDASKIPIRLKWEGWSDSLSGIDHYSLSIFKLFTDQNGNLREPLQPTTTVLFSSLNLSYVYEPSDAGVFSFVLSIEDKASNRKYARQLAIYDPTSVISLGTNDAELMYISSSNSNTNHSWQSIKTEITVNWTNHFVNWVHVNGSFLKQFVTKPINGVYKYYITDNMDDHSGHRSLAAIPNINGIVRFEYGYVQHTGSEPNIWRRVSPLKETVMIRFNGTIHDNDYVVVFVKATDIIGNQKTDYTRINFDSTPPNILDGTNLTFTRSKSFSSSLSVHVVDTESGINHIDAQIQTDKGVELWSGHIDGNKTTRGSCTRRPGGCSCGNSNLPDECYNFLHIMKLNHCSMVPPPNTNDILTLNIQIYNNANLPLRKVLKIGPALSLKGLGVYEAPINIHTELISPTGVRLSWSFGASCYKRTSIRIENEISGEINLSENVTSHDLEGLEPGTNYDFKFTVFYGTRSSQPTTFNVKTDGDNPMSYIIAVAIESVIIVAFLATAIFIFKTKCKSSTTDNIEKRISAPPNRYINQGMKMSNFESQDRDISTTASTCGLVKEPESIIVDSNMALSSEEQPTTMNQNYYESANNHPDFEENFYEDLSAEEQSHQSKDITRRDIKLEEVLFNGDYSNVLQGTISTNNGAVAVRIPNLNETIDKQIKEFEDLIRSIMEYTVTQIGTHQNILNYIVQFPGGKDIYSEPPMLVMELCTEGSLNEWLQKYGEGKAIDVPTLHQIGFCVASGMEYLKIREIFHGNLCSENVLLTSQLVPKIKGFGPSISEKTKRYEKNMPPECLESDYIDPCEAVDSWAYGIVLWEIFSPGKTPYDDISDEKLLEELNNGYRLPDSEYAPKKHNALMKICWNDDKKQRPSFHDIVEVLSGPIDYVPQENPEPIQDEFYENM